ncbi:hypothetical protein JCM2811A_15450 [Methylorubrum rhodinum]
MTVTVEFMLSKNRWSRLTWAPTSLNPPASLRETTGNGIDDAHGSYRNGSATERAGLIAGPKDPVGGACRVPSGPFFVAETPTPRDMQTASQKTD